MKLRITITALIIVQGILTFAQDTLKLSDAIVLALQNNYSISLAEKVVKISEITNSAGNAGMVGCATLMMQKRTIKMPESSFRGPYSMD